jgi:hypothetical protein
MIQSRCCKKGVVHVICCVEEEFPCGPVGGAVARAFPLFCKKTSGKQRQQVEGDNDELDDGAAKQDGDSDEDERLVHVTFLDSSGKIVKDSRQIDAAKAAAEGVRLACRLVGEFTFELAIVPFDTNYYSLVLFTFCPQTINNTNAPSDTHPEELTTTAFAQECHDLFQDEPHVSIEEIVGDELRDRGYGGIYNVGKAANHPPRLVILTYDPNTDNEVNDEKDSIALVGKGIVYDTGGLAIKSKTGMCGMKSDMGGAAGVCELK